MTEDSDSCSTCKIGSLKPTGEIVIDGESTGEFREIGSRRVFHCENCGQRSVRVANHKYAIITSNVKTKHRKEDV